MKFINIYEKKIQYTNLNWILFLLEQLYNNTFELCFTVLHVSSVNIICSLAYIIYHDSKINVQYYQSWSPLRNYSLHGKLKRQSRWGIIITGIIRIFLHQEYLLRSSPCARILEGRRVCRGQWKKNLINLSEIEPTGYFTFTTFTLIWTVSSGI